MPIVPIFIVVVVLLAVFLAVSVMCNCRFRNKIRQFRSAIDVERHRRARAGQDRNRHIGKLLCHNSQVSQSVESFAMQAGQKLKTGQYDSIKRQIDRLLAGHGKRQVLQHFDEAFISMFPHFICRFNALLLPGNEQPDTGTLTPTMRIFALIMLGIDDTEHIARILYYSCNTVYNYRMRMRGKARRPDTFEADVVAIGL